MKKYFFLSIFLFCLSASAFSADISYIKVTTSEVNVYLKAGNGWTDHRATRNAYVKVTGAMKDGWYPVKLRNGVEGWLPSWLTTPVKEKMTLPPAFTDEQIPTSYSPLYGKVIADGVYFRAIPYGGLSGKWDTSRQGDIPAGAVLKITDRIGHWMSVQLAPMESGWVYDEALAPAEKLNGSNWNGMSYDIKYIKITKQEKRTFITIKTGVPLPYEVESSLNPDIIKFKVYDVNCDTMREIWETTCERAGGWCGCPHGSNMLSGHISLARKPEGYSAGYEDNILRISVRNPGNPILQKVVVIDPGHGAPTPFFPGYKEGAPGPGGCLEKDVVLSVSKKLEANLKKLGFATALTRTGDTVDMVDLNKRIAFSDKANGDIFVSIHANGDNDPSYEGLEIYWYEEQSRPLAEILATTTPAATGQLPGKTFFSSFGVIRQTRIPAVLVELGYLSNKKEGALVCSEKYQENAAKGLAAGISRYIASMSE